MLHSNLKTFSPSVLDPTDFKGIHQALDRHGVCVVANILTDIEQTNFLDLFWKAIEKRHNDLRSCDNSTWTAGNTDWYGTFGAGQYKHYGMAQEGHCWLVRKNKVIRDIFERGIYGHALKPHEDCCVSLDGCAALFRPCKSGLKMHVDVVPGLKGFDFGSVQGAYNLYPVRADRETKRADAGFVCVVGSHKQYDQIWRNRMSKKGFKMPKKHWHELEADSLLQHEGSLVLSPPNSLVLWRSDLLHRNYGGDFSVAELNQPWPLSHILPLAEVTCTEGEDGEREVTGLGQATASKVMESTPAFDKPQNFNQDQSQDQGQKLIKRKGRGKGKEQQETAMDGKGSRVPTTSQSCEGDNLQVQQSSLPPPFSRAFPPHNFDVCLALPRRRLAVPRPRLVRLTQFVSFMPKRHRSEADLVKKAQSVLDGCANNHWAALGLRVPLVPFPAWSEAAKAIPVISPFGDLLHSRDEGGGTCDDDDAKNEDGSGDEGEGRGKAAPLSAAPTVAAAADDEEADAGKRPRRSSSAKAESATRKRRRITKTSPLALLPRDIQELL